MPRQAHHRLRDEVARITPHLLQVRLDLLARGGRADQHAVPTGLAHRLEHQILRVRQHEFQLLGVPAQVRGHVVQDRRLVQVVADHVRHVRVHRLVVRDARPDGVGDRHAPLPVHVHQSRHAQRAVPAERQRIEEIVVDAAVDHVHLPPPTGRAHPHPPAVHEQVTALDEFHAHLLREVRVLEVRAVVHAGRQHDHGAVLARAAGQQQFQQRRRVVLHGPHALPFEHAGVHAGHRLPVGQQVRHAARRAQVVLQHEVLALLVADQVRAHHVREDPAGRQHAVHLAPEVRRGVHQFRRDHAVPQDLRAAVDVGQERVQRPHPLRQARLDVRPLARRDDARHRIERERPLGALRVPVHRERDALIAEGQIQQLMPPPEFLHAQRVQVRLDPLVVGARRAECREHLIVEPAARLVPHRLSSPPRS